MKVKVKVIKGKKIERLKLSVNTQKPKTFFVASCVITLFHDNSNSTFIINMHFICMIIYLNKKMKKMDKKLLLNSMICIVRERNMFNMYNSSCFLPFSFLKRIISLFEKLKQNRIVQFIT